MPSIEPPPPIEPRLRLGVSACLLGEEVRHDGGHKRDTFLMNLLGRYVEWVSVCPEVEVGMTTPRPALRLVGTVENPRMITIKTGEDWTRRMDEWSRSRAEDLAPESLVGFVFKKGSPSCGLFRVKVYDKNTIPSATGRGLFARALTDRYPLLPVEEEGRLHDHRLRENFIDRLFAFHRWRQLVSGKPKPADLVAFHTSYKLTLMSHDPRAPARLGRLVAEAGRLGMPRLLEDYGSLFMEALARMATHRKHANTLQHLMGYLKKALPSEEKAELLDLIDDYRNGMIPLVVPVTLLKHHLARHDVPDWVHQQVYLHPYPKEMLLRNHV